MTRLIVISVVLVAACKQEAPKQQPPPGPRDDGKVAIYVTEKGFEPADVKVTRGQPITLVFERKTDKTCAKEIILHVDDTQTIEKALPLNQPVEVAVTFPTSGDLTYTCAMDMVKGSIHVQ